MTSIAYLDCFSGISGDMLLGALLDAGLSARALRRELAKLRLKGYRLRAGKTRRASLAATQVTVELKKDQHHPHRRLNDILAVIEQSDLPAGDKEKGASVFRRLAEAEARVHGTTLDSVVLHEVGSLDTLVDVLGAVAGLRLLGVEELFASALPLGQGNVEAAHGTLPVPAPATLELLAQARAPISAAGWQGELVTPTGAAIVTTLASFERPAMRVTTVGYGAGSRDPADRPNVLRLWLGERLPSGYAVMLMVEANIDDMSPEILSYVQEHLFAAGAADVWFTPIQMKKNRPATKLSVLCSADREDAVVGVLLRESSTLGVRVTEVRRHEAVRETVKFPSSLGAAIVKVKRLEGEPPQISPEYEACRRLAQRRSLPLAEVYRIVQAEAQAYLKGRGIR
jgi:uncharacterized protein (TIGR00299 family) protein